MLFGEVRDDQMGVVLGGAGRCVAEQLLHVTEVSTAPEKMRCEAVSQRVGGDPAEVEVFTPRRVGLI